MSNLWEKAWAILVWPLVLVGRWLDAKEDK